MAPQQLGAREGWLHKKGVYNPSYRKRFFRLQGNALRYFKTPEASERGIVKLQDITVNTDVKGEPLAFVLSPTKGTPRLSRPPYVLKANDEADKIAWVTAISQAISAQATMPRQPQARPETIAFLEQVHGFINKRNELNDLAQEVLPDGLANQYPNFPAEKAELKQDRSANESLEQIKSDPGVAKTVMDRLRSDAKGANRVLEALGKKIVQTALDVDPSAGLFREPATAERLAEGKGDKVQLHFNLGPLKGTERCDEVICTSLRPLCSNGWNHTSNFNLQPPRPLPI